MTYYIDTIDNRNKILYELLKKENKKVEIFDLTTNKYLSGDAIIFAPNKKIDEEYVSWLPNKITLYGGKFNSTIQELLKRKNINYINLLDDEIFAIKNANLTCEGVLALMIENSPKSIFENNVLILGAGRIAKFMGILLSKLGVKYSLASFNKEKFAQNYTYSDNNYFAYDFVRDLSKFDIIINTIPAEIIDQNIIDCISNGTVFIETASINCLDNSKVKNFKYILAPALPQRYSCYSAGKLMLDSILGRNLK